MHLVLAFVLGFVLQVTLANTLAHIFSEVWSNEKIQFVALGIGLLVMYGLSVLCSF